VPEHSLPNRWLATQDPRFNGLLEIARSIDSGFQTQAAIEEVVDSGFQDGPYLFPSPLELASLLEEAAGRIRNLTAEGS
jgi:hypothetical protein